MIAAIVVLFHPERKALERLMASLVGQVGAVFAIDNTPSASSATSHAFLDKFGAFVLYIPLGENKGIAEAQNIGIELSTKSGCSHVLLLDQDSAPCPGMIQKLLDAEENLLRKGEHIAAMTPQLIDERTGKFPCASRYGWFRARLIFCGIDSVKPIQTDNFIASGSLIRVSALQALGMMRSDLFIEHVDTEWAFRANTAGYRSYCVPNALMRHCFGDAAAKILGKNLYIYSNLRYYYKLRNEVYLMRLRTMGSRWRVYIFFRIPYHLLLYFALSENRTQALCLFRKAILDGIFGRLGPAASGVEDTAK